MTARSFWLRVALATSVALALALALAPPQPAVRLAPAAAAVLGAAAGTLLFVCVTRRAPRPSNPRRRTAIVLAKQLVLGLCATNEEIVWRRVVLGELLPAGAFSALAASSAGFAVVHRRARPLHVLTGTVFGCLYLSTGVLAASVTAHWTYNAFVGTLVQRRPP